MGNKNILYTTIIGSSSDGVVVTDGFGSISTAEASSINNVTVLDARTTALETQAINNKGYFGTPLALTTAYPVGTAGWFAIVGSTDTLWVWDTNTSSWADTDTKGQVQSINTLTGVVVLSQDEILDGTTYKQYSQTEKTKLAGIATGAEVNVQSDWTQNNNLQDDYIKNKPTLSTVATSGNHNDLSNIGTNTHAQIDLHIADTTNPHLVTKSQVGLSNVPNIDTTNANNIIVNTKTAFNKDFGNIIGTITEGNDGRLGTKNIDETNIGNNKIQVYNNISGNLEYQDQLITSTNLGISNNNATSLDITSDTGTDATIPSATTLLSGLLSATDKTKLNGIATGATANSTDAYLLDRTNHTSTQTASTISDFQSTVSSNTDVSANTTARHTHANKALLDTYTQTEVDLADAVAKKHTHANFTALDNVSGVNTGDETTSSIQTKRPLKTVASQSIEGSGNITLTSSDVGLGNVVNVDTTNPANITQTASYRFVTDAEKSTWNGKEDAITAGTVSQYYRGDKTFQTLDQTAVGLGNVDNTSDINKPISTATQTALNLKADLNSPNLTGTPLAPTAATNTNTTQIATTQFVNNQVAAYVAAQDVEVLKGPLDCSTNPDYPAADAGWVYRVSATGKIGGVSGVNVEVGDRLECFIDSSPSGTQASVGSNWIISQVNIDGAVISNETATSNDDFVVFSGTSGKVIKKVTLAGYKTLLALVKADVGLGNVLNVDSTDLSNDTIQGTFTPANTAIVTGQDGKTAFQNAQGQINNRQPLDATLTSLASYNTDGLLTQTTADTFVGRVIQGTNGVVVTNGNGVAGNPSIAPTYGTTVNTIAQGNDTRIVNAEQTTNKNASNGYVGLTLFNINFRNVANTITSIFTNTNTVARTYTFQDRTGTIADTGNLSQFASTTSAQLATVLSDETGTGLAVFNTSPSLITPSITGAGANFAGSTSGTSNLRAAAVAGGTSTLPITTGTLVGSGDTGTVTSTMILNGTILDTDINATANIATSKLRHTTVSTAKQAAYSSPDTVSTIIDRLRGWINTGTRNRDTTGDITGGASFTAVTADNFGMVNIGQTTPNISHTVAAPTVTNLGQTLYWCNSGTAEYRINGMSVAPGTARPLVWNGTAWLPLSTGVKEYLKVTRSTDITLNNGNIIVLNSVLQDVGIGALSYNTSTGDITLTANKTFDIIYQPVVRYVSGGGNKYVVIQITDTANVKIPGSTECVVFYAASSLNEAGNAFAHARITVGGSNQVIRLRIIDLGGDTAVQVDGQDRQALIIQEI